MVWNQQDNSSSHEGAGPKGHQKSIQKGIKLVFSPELTAETADTVMQSARSVEWAVGARMFDGSTMVSVMPGDGVAVRCYRDGALPVVLFVGESPEPLQLVSALSYILASEWDASRTESTKHYEQISL